MNSIILPGTSDSVRLFIAGKLMQMSNQPVGRVSFGGEASFYPPYEDVPYLTETLHRSFLLVGMDFEELRYWIVSSLDFTLNRMDPVLSQETADRMLCSMAFRHKFPMGYDPENGATVGKKLYEFAATHHPDEKLRDTLLSLSVNFPFWTVMLTKFGREISLLV